VSDISGATYAVNKRSRRLEEIEKSSSGDNDFLSGKDLDEVDE